MLLLLVHTDVRQLHVFRWTDGRVSRRTIGSDLSVAAVWDGISAVRHAIRIAAGGHEDVQHFEHGVGKRVSIFFGAEVESIDLSLISPLVKRRCRLIVLQTACNGTVYDDLRMRRRGGKVRQDHKGADGEKEMVVVSGKGDSIQANIRRMRSRETMARHATKHQPEMRTRGYGLTS